MIGRKKERGEILNERREVKRKKGRRILPFLKTYVCVYIVIIFPSDVATLQDFIFLKICGKLLRGDL